MNIINETGEQHIIKEYDLEMRQWTSLHNMKQTD